MKDLPNRRPCVTEEVGMGLAVTVSYHPETRNPCRSIFNRTGKASDNPMQEALYNMGVSASKLMQEENPYAKPFSQDNQKAAV